MTIPLRELRHRYKVLRAVGDALPRGDLGFEAPISTGSKVLDSMFLEKVTATATMTAPEHLRRSWSLVEQASPAELEVLRGLRGGILRDHLMLLAVRGWRDGGTAGAAPWLEPLPIKWKLLFPVALIKPSSVFLHGWRGELDFRFAGDPKFSEIKEWYRALLADLSPSTIIKFRAHIKAATALLHYKFEGPRERAIHDWCFGGDDLAAIPELKDARAAAALFEKGDPPGPEAWKRFEQTRLPLTYFVGLIAPLSPKRAKLDEDGLFWVRPSVWKDMRLLNYAVNAASPTECILMLRSWGPHLTPDHVNAIAAKIEKSRGTGGIPFDQICKAIVACPPALRLRLMEPLFFPLLSEWGAKMKDLIPAGAAFNMVQPANLASPMSFLFYAALLAGGGKGRLVLLGGSRGRAAEVTELDAAKCRQFLLSAEGDLKVSLLELFGGAALRTDYTFDPAELREALGRLDPHELLVLDVPFCFHPAVLHALARFDFVVNIGGYFGAPGELPLDPSFFEVLFVRRDFDIYGFYYRKKDNPLPQLVSFVERLKWVGAAAEA